MLWWNYNSLVSNKPVYQLCISGWTKELLQSMCSFCVWFILTSQTDKSCKTEQLWTAMVQNENVLSLSSTTVPRKMYYLHNKAIVRVKKKKDIQTMFPFGLGSLLFILHNVLKWKVLSCFLPWCDLCSAAFGPDSHSCDNSPCHVMPLHASALTVRTTGCSSVVDVRSHNAAYTQTQRIMGNSVSAELTDTFHGP